jgi:putative peptidoglycan lipid II flippase
MSLLRAATTVGSYTAISRIFGLVREVFLSHVLGAGMVADAFVVAFKFPNFFRRFFAEGAFNAAFVPQFAGILANKEAQNASLLAKELAQKVFSNLAWFLLIFVILVELTTPYLIPILAPGFATTPERLDLAIQFTRITFPYILFISLSALLAGVLNSLHHFAAAAAAPILLNLMMISALVFYPQTGMKPAVILCWSVFVAGLIQFSWLYYVCRKLDFKFWLTWPSLTTDVKKILKLMVPGTIGAGVMQINLFVDMMLASRLPAGSISYLYYADRLNHLPLSIFGVAIGTALLPMLSKAWRQGNREQAYYSQNKALDFALQLTIPASIGLMVLAYPLIDLIFGHGNFQKEDVLATAPALAAFAFGLPAYVTGKVFATTYFACEDTSTPVKIAILCVVTNLCLNLLFMPAFKHTGMALATSLAAWLNTIILAIILKRRQLFLFSRALLKKVIRVSVVSLLMGLILIGIQQLWPMEALSIYHKAINTLSLVIFGGAFYLILGYKIGIRPFNNFKS